MDSHLFVGALGARYWRRAIFGLSLAWRPSKWVQEERGQTQHSAQKSRLITISAALALCLPNLGVRYPQTARANEFGYLLFLTSIGMLPETWLLLLSSRLLSTSLIYHRPRHDPARHTVSIAEWSAGRITRYMASLFLSDPALYLQKQEIHSWNWEKITIKMGQGSRSSPRSLSISPVDPTSHLLDRNAPGKFLASICSKYLQYLLSLILSS